MMNKYMAIGNLTQDPQCKDVGETKVCNFGIAINEFFYKNQQKQKTTLFIDIETWSKQAENCVKFLKKGSKVAVEGKLKMNSWEKNGQKFTKVFCLSDKVHFLGSDEQNSTKAPNAKEAKKEVSLSSSSTSNNDVDDVDIDDIPF
jgi:single-strand DNA-binding protein